MSQLTIIDLAAKLGLSKSTVSRAFRNNNDINPETRKRILAMADELGFSPNMHASNLRASRSQTIAIVIPEFGNKFFSQAIKGIERVTRSKGYHTLIYVTDHQVQNEASIIRSLSNGRVDGILMSASGEGNEHSHLNLLADNNIPIVFFDRNYEDINTVFVTGNDEESSFFATQHLIENGCKRIAYLAINPNVSIGKIRMDGYKQALVKHNVAIDDRLILATSNDAGINMEDIRKLLKEEKPDGILASVERLAISTLRVAKEENILVPNDLKLICFSCLDITDLLQPSLSVVKQPAFEMGKVASNYLFEALNKPFKLDKQQTIILDSSLIYQDSSKKIF